MFAWVSWPFLPLPKFFSWSPSLFLLHSVLCISNILEENPRPASAVCETSPWPWASVRK